jgi:hypothetical protein
VGLEKVITTTANLLCAKDITGIAALNQLSIGHGRFQGTHVASQFTAMVAKSFPALP